MNRAEKVKQRKPNLSRKGENFAGLQTYIISEIDSGSDQEGKQSAGKNLGFLSDASSFSNSESSEGEQANYQQQQNSSCSDEAEEQ